MLAVVRSQQSIGSYFLGGLPAFIASTALEQVAVTEARRYPVHVSSAMPF